MLDLFVVAGFLISVKMISLGHATVTLVQRVRAAQFYMNGVVCAGNLV
jgi:hypothetical protein